GLALIGARHAADIAAFAQTQPAGKDAADEAGPSAPAPAPNGNASDSATPTTPAAAPPAAPPSAEINVFDLAMQGGIFMYPIYALSILMVTVIIERYLGLRRDRVMPDALISALGHLGTAKTGFDPRRAYRLCQDYPSAAANVIKAMLLKVGRPHSEVEHTVQEVSEREANRMYGNVRWLNLCSSVTPLIGLLGTVQGMIVAFHQTTVLAPGANKAVELANGIYTALVTTFGGLCVAIPSSIFAHYFEGRIQNLFSQVDELLFNLLPQVERYENRMRFAKSMAEGSDEPPVAS
ncbi:MAG TPA: MotA/TolQ/ExbB proton channel family protein, partial [Pirellulaceae bacterium]|nr:MotA/TolQ/ExbB proton channel family protein [Pirellulaceae bacterium]